MTLPFSHRSPSLLARSALLAVVLAGSAGTAASQDRTSAAPTARVAVLAGPDAAGADVARAFSDRAGRVEVRRVGGPLEAVAAAAALAGEGYSTVVGIGAQARAAVAQAEAGEVGADTRWDSGR
jgi:hypothetical protein